jgi:protein-arginine kinase activator protein McsA
MCPHCHSNHARLEFCEEDFDGSSILVYICNNCVRPFSAKAFTPPELPHVRQHNQLVEQPEPVSAAALLEAQPLHKPHTPIVAHANGSRHFVNTLEVTERWL